MSKKRTSAWNRFVISRHGRGMSPAEISREYRVRVLLETLKQLTIDQDVTIGEMEDTIMSSKTKIKEQESEINNLINSHVDAWKLITQLRMFIAKHNDRTKACDHMGLDHKGDWKGEECPLSTGAGCGYRNHGFCWYDGTLNDEPESKGDRGSEESFNHLLNGFYKEAGTIAMGQSIKEELEKERRLLNILQDDYELKCKQLDHYHEYKRRSYSIIWAWNDIKKIRFETNALKKEFEETTGPGHPQPPTDIEIIHCPRCNRLFGYVESAIFALSCPYCGGTIPPHSWMKCDKTTQQINNELIPTISLDADETKRFLKDLETLEYSNKMIKFVEDSIKEYNNIKKR